MKFLRKVSILPDAWLKDKEMGLVPLEIALLAKISHPHIVEVRMCVHTFSKLMHCNIKGSGEFVCTYTSNSSSVNCVALCYSSAGKM